MKKLFVFLLLLILLPFISYAQIWEGNGGEFIQEGIGFGSGSGGGGWIPEPLDPDMTHYTISFKDDNETTSLFSPIELNENTVVDLSVFVPTRSEGYDFSHWENSNGDTVTSVTMTADTTVYAVWTAHTHSITWQITDYSKEPVATYTSVDNNIVYGSIIVASSTPAVPTNYVFSGWNNLPLTMPDYNLTISGTIDSVGIVFKLSEIPYDSENPERYQIIYDGSIANNSPITYSGGVVNMGDWEDWINDHFTPVMLRSDGTVDYELSRTNQNYKADGVTPSDIANANYDGNAMLQIKKFYISCSTETEGVGGDSHQVHTISISDSKKNNTYTCYGFIDANGVEHDYVYYALYCCHVDNNSKLRSLSGITLNATANGNHLKSYSDIVTAAKANGNGWSISNLALENAIGLVMMMVYKDTNPMFVAQEWANGTSVLHPSADVCKITGTRSASGGFPYTLKTEQPKSLWIENYWRSYSSSGNAAVWVNGLASLKDTSTTYFAYYKLTEPFDLSNVNDWTYMSNTQTYTYSSNSHLTNTTTFYDNILFPKDSGWSRTAYVFENSKRCFGSGPLEGMAGSYQSTTQLYPAKTGGITLVDQYTTPPHFCSYYLYGSRNDGLLGYGSGRLTYLPQPTTLSGLYSPNSLHKLQESLIENRKLHPVETELIRNSTDTQEIEK